MRESASTDRGSPRGAIPWGHPAIRPLLFLLPCLGDVGVCPGEVTGPGCAASLSSTRSNWPRSSIVSAMGVARRENLCAGRRPASGQVQGGGVCSVTIP